MTRIGALAGLERADLAVGAGAARAPIVAAFSISAALIRFV